MAKYEYGVQVTKKVTSVGTFIVESKKKLTEEEVTEEASVMANDGKEPNGGWEETDTDYDEYEVVDGADDLKED